MFNKKISAVNGKIFFIMIILNSINLFSQFQPDVRLTNDPSISYTSYNNSWAICANGNVIHVVWQDHRDGNYEIYYKRSTDGGVTWGTDARITNDVSISENACVAVSGQTVHIIWQDNRAGQGNTEIYYKRSSDGGVTWGTDIRLTNDAAFSQYPCVSVNGSDVHVVWYDLRDADYEIYYKHSTDGGLTWSNDIRLTNSTGISYYPSAAVNGNVIHVVWYDNRGGNNYHIYYKRSTDNGTSWSSDIHISDTISDGADPCVSVSGSIVNVVWEDNRNGNLEVYNKHSTDGGVSWSADLRLTNDAADSRHPSIASSGSGVQLVWDDQRPGYQQLYYKRSTDGGVTWSADLRITNVAPFSAYPSLCISGASVNVVWEDTRDGNVEIYYKKDPTGNPTGITNISAEIPKRFSLSQNYPNPFNPSTKIKFDIPASVGNGDMRFVQINVYDILGRQVSVLVNQNMQPGSYVVDFDGSRLASGLYFYKLEAGDFTETKKMLMIK